MPRSKTFLFFSGHAHRALDPAAKTASGGAELQVALLARELARRGYGCVIAAAEDGFEDGVAWQGVRVRAAGHFETGGLRDALQALHPVVRVIREEKPDWVIVYGWTSWLAVLCLIRPFLKFRVAFVCALDSEIDGGFRKANPVRGRLFDWGMRAADARFSITAAQAEMFRRQGMSCMVTRLLLTERPHTAKKSLDLLWVARCHPVKRPGLFLDLVEGLPGVKARMICSPQDATLHAAMKARAAGIPGLEFLDGVPYHEIQSHFNQARIFVNTSSDEGVPNTFLHSGLGGAAIVSLTADPDGMLARFGAGFCAGGDPDAMVAATRALLKNPAALGSAAAGARSFIVAWHDNAKNVDAFLQGL